jgi:hypothetical protein
MSVLIVMSVLCMVFSGMWADAGEGCSAPSVVETKDANTPEQKEPLAGAWIAKDVYVYTNKSWKLEISYLNMGTRSEGQHGVLYENNKPVTGTKKGASRVTPLGLLKYYGDERKQAWSLTGWNFADRRKVRGSESLPAQENKAAESNQ